jgi:2-iminoacetate synthase ThiH
VSSLQPITETKRGMYKSIYIHTDIPNYPTTLCVYTCLYLYYPILSR